MMTRRQKRTIYMTTILCFVGAVVFIILARRGPPVEFDPESYEPEPLLEEIAP